MNGQTEDKSVLFIYSSFEARTITDTSLLSKANKNENENEREKEREKENIDFRLTQFRLYAIFN